MKRMKFRFLACVAMVLAFVMWFEVPASAVEAVYYDITEYHVSTTSSGRVKTQEFMFPVYDTSFMNVTVSDLSYKSTQVLYDFARSCELTVPEDTNLVRFQCFPLGSGNSSVGTMGYLDLMAVEASSPTSFTVTFYLLVESSVPISGDFYFYAYIGNKTHSDSFSLSIGDSGYVYLPLTVDLLEYQDFDDLTTVRFNTVCSFPQPPAGAMMRFSIVANPESIDFDPFVYATLTDVKQQDVPSFTQNLSSDTVWYLVGSSPTALSVNASVSDGGSISYQWYKSNTVSGSGIAISGATGRSYTPDTSAESDCYYYCIATSTLDGEKKSAKSNVAHIGVVKKPAAPVIYSNLHTGTLEYYQGETAESLFFGVYAPDGGTLTYQWYEGDPSYGDPKAIPGATSSSYTPSTAVIGTDYYYCIATNTKGPYTQSVSSREGRVLIKAPPDPALPPVITTDLSTDPVTYKEGVAASPLRIIATSPDGGTLSYQWYEVIDGSAQILAGDTNANFTPDTSVVGEHIYYCVVTNTVLNTKASVESSRATIVVQPDRTDSLLDTIIGGVTDIIDGIANLPQLIIDGIKNLFIPDAEGMAAYQDKWFQLLSSRFGAIYEAVVLIDEFGQAISEQTKQGIVTFPEVTINLAGVPWTFGGWEVKVVPDGFDVVIVTLKSAVNIVCTFAFVNGLRHRFEGVIGGA